ncbi:MAG: MFS transporter [bacterium]
MFGHINKVIKILVFSDLLLLFGWGLIAPILAIFVVQNIQGGDAGVAGIAIGIYWLVKSIIQVFIANFLDKHKGEKDDLYSLIFGTILASLVPIGFIFAHFPWQIYLLQGIHALGMAFAVPSWSGIFTRHIEKGREAFCWSLDSSALGIGAGIAGIIGGTIAKTFGFVPLFVGVSVFGIISSLIIFLIKKDLLPKEKVYPMPKPY